VVGIIRKYVREFPGVADVGIVIHRHHGMTVAVFHRFPRRLRALGLHRHDAAVGELAQMARAGNPRQIPLLDVVQHVAFRVGCVEIGNRLAGQHLRHSAGEDLPLRRIGAPEIVGHQVAATQQILAQTGDFLRAQAPPSGLRSVNPRIVEEPGVGEAHVAWIAHIDTRQALQA
jgi:hypothetical protein